MKNKERDEKMELIHEDLTHELIGCLFEVHSSLGVGYDEPAYHKALERRFRKRGIKHRSEERKALTHRGRHVREFKADLVTFDKIILELKALPSDFIKLNIKYQNRTPIELNYDGEVISVFKMKPFLIENRVICDIKALHEKIDFYDIAKIQSYLRALNLKIGIIANSGKSGLEIRGIRA
jgi:GxxExxY protein